jgi:regulator of sigma E protease
MTILIFFAVLFVLILVHEWGHFIVAKRNGIRVDEFGIGFPPKLFGIKRGETEYTLNLLPIGGFVKIYGENAEDASKDASGGGDISRSFVAKSKLVQAAVLVAGVTMNILFAWLLFVIVFAVGVPTAIEESEAGPEARLIISQVLPNGPAAEAGVPAGAEVLSLSSGDESEEILYPSSFSNFTETHSEIALTYRIADEIRTVSIEPQVNIIELNPEQPAVGVALALVETVKTPLHLAIYKGLVTTLSGLKNITIGLGSLLYDSVKGQADFSQIAGPVGIVGLVGEAADFGFTSLLMFTAFISLNLAVINMLPFPALDGGRLVFVAIETITRRPINPVWVARLNIIGFALLILLMVAVTYNDIIRIT